MSQFFYIHPDNPQQRLINQAVDIVRKGGVIVYPTDSGYALGCKIEDKGAMERICRIRHLPDGHNFTLMCRDLSELSTYSYVDNVAFRLMKNNTPGNYTFILKGTKEVPRRLLHLRGLVELPPETSSKVAVEKDRRRMKANQIRRAVKRHSQIAGGRRSGGRNNNG